MKTERSTTPLISIFALLLFASPLAAQVGTPWDKQFAGPTRYKILSEFGNASGLRQGDWPRVGAVAKYGNLPTVKRPLSLQYDAGGESLWVATSHHPGIVQSN